MKGPQKINSNLNKQIGCPAASILAKDIDDLLIRKVNDESRTMRNKCRQWPFGVCFVNGFQYAVLPKAVLYE